MGDEPVQGRKTRFSLTNSCRSLTLRAACQRRGKPHCICTGQDSPGWVLSAPALPSRVTLQKLLNLSGPQFPICKMVMVLSTMLLWGVIGIMCAKHLFQYVMIKHGLLSELLSSLPCYGRAQQSPLLWKQPFSGHSGCGRRRFSPAGPVVS